MLNLHLKVALLAGLLLAASTAAAETLYTINTAAGTLMRFNSNTAQVTTVGPIGFQFFGADLAYFDGSIYAITAHADGFFANAGYSLLKINPQTGALLHSTEILVNGDKPFFMESIGVANGKLYVGFNPSATVSTHLGQINPVTGVITGTVDYFPIPGMNALFGSFGVDFDGMSDHPTQGGSVLTMDNDAGLISLVRVDPVNVTASSEGQFFYTGGALDDVAVGRSGVYAIGDGRLHFFNADLDGVVQYKNFDPVGQFAGLTVPEPSGIVLGALGLLAVIGCRRFSRRGISLALLVALGLLAASQPSAAGVVTSKTILNLPVNALKMDPVRDILYAAVPSSGGVGVGNSITRIDLLTRTIMDSTFIGSEPQAITVSSDGSQMYVDISGAFKIRAVDLNTMTPGPQSTVPENYIVADLAAVPTRPDTFVASLLRAGSPQYVGLQVWQFDGTTFTHDPIEGIAAYNLAYSPDPSTFYATSGQNLAKVTLGPGDSLSAQYGGSLGGPDPGIALDGDLLVSTQARAFDLTDFTAAGQFSGGEFSGGVAVDAAAGHVYMLRGQTIRIFDMTTFLQIDSLTIPEVGNAGSYTLLRYGVHGLAFNTDQGQVILIESHAIGVPEPSSVILAVIGIVGLAVSTLWRRRKPSA